MPILLPANKPPHRFYRGGPQIDQFRGTKCSSQDSGLSEAFEPEDWVASTTPCHGCRPLGLTRLPDGRWLADAVAEEPAHWLGAAHVAAFGADTKLLVKLLDAGQRLPVHAHPDGAWVRQHMLGATHGKAEAWYVLAGGAVHLGLQEDISLGELQRLVQEQAIVPGLLEKLHRFDVVPHQTVYVPPGTLHALGEGVLVVEVQEPSDLSVLLEWTGFAIDGASKGHLGVGWETALTAVDRAGRSRKDMQKLIVNPDLVKAEDRAAGVLAAPSEAFFRMERLRVVPGEQKTLECGFAVMVILDGALNLTSTSSAPLQLTKGNTVLLAFADGDVVLAGTGDVVVARPPRS